MYVDDILITAPEAIAASALERLRQEWTCSEPEWIGEGSWVKFCGMELKKEQASSWAAVLRSGPPGETWHQV